MHADCFLKRNKIKTQILLAELQVDYVWRMAETSWVADSNLFLVFISIFANWRLLCSQYALFWTLWIDSKSSTWAIPTILLEEKNMSLTWNTHIQKKQNMPVYLIILAAAKPRESWNKSCMYLFWASILSCGVLKTSAGYASPEIWLFSFQSETNLSWNRFHVSSIVFRIHCLYTYANGEFNLCIAIYANMHNPTHWCKPVYHLIHQHVHLVQSKPRWNSLKEPQCRTPSDRKKKILDRSPELSFRLPLSNQCEDLHESKLELSHKTFTIHHHPNTIIHKTVYFAN